MYVRWRHGSGRPTLACCRHSDLDIRMITRAAAFAAQHHAMIGYAVGRSEALPFCDQSVDLVVSVAMFTFVREAHRAVREMARVLRPGGRGIPLLAA
jgi:ubiquinone/menaquinone biosynthesis C-methylase UbiE